MLLTSLKSIFPSELTPICIELIEVVGPVKPVTFPELYPIKILLELVMVFVSSL